MAGLRERKSRGWAAAGDRRAFGGQWQHSGDWFRPEADMPQPMATLSIEQQIAVLRPTMGFAAHMHKWFLFGAALGVIAAIIFWHPVPLILSAFLAIVGFSEQRAGPNIVAAIAAYDLGTPTIGEATISITCWDTDNHYHAKVREPDHPDWEYEFVPQVGSLLLEPIRRKYGEPVAEGSLFSLWLRTES